MKKRLNLDNPRTFNEKLQWLKLYDRKPLYTTIADKYRVKKWASDRIPECYIPKTYAVWKSAEEIDITSLPDTFVLKTNHDCGGVCICSDKNSFDLDEAKNKLRDHLRINYYYTSREWPYKNIKPLVFAEEYLTALDSDTSGAGDIPDCKIMCFGGKPVLAQVHRGRTGMHTQDFYELPEWNRVHISQGFPESDTTDAAPSDLGLMLEMSALLSAGFPQLRVDWFVSREGLKLGELTLFDGSGFDPFDPEEWDVKLGTLIELPN